ncbi:MAG: class I SAM-dependent methyltransferase, partial [Phaeodactylibacter sp.]|nr:class I SAM-dependent methyltransferase [Phaeodactylibacter sp.]
MRLMNQEKAGYFPLPPELVPIIGSHYTAPPGARILDPCAGKGAVLHQLAQLHQMHPFGVELNKDRAAQAQQLLGPDNILQDSYQNLLVPPGSFSVLYNNPPYLFVEDKTLGRAEYMWLRDTRAHLMPGGLLIYVIPRHLLHHTLASKYLATWFDSLRVYRFPDGLYERFKQVIVFGIRRPKSGIADPERVEKLRRMGKGELTIPELRLQEKPLYSVPPRPERPFHFRSIFVSPKHAIAEAARKGIVTGDTFKNHLEPTATAQPLTPLAPLKIGHMNSIIAAGHLNNQVLQACTEQGRS